MWCYTSNTLIKVTKIDKHEYHSIVVLNFFYRYTYYPSRIYNGYVEVPTIYFCTDFTLDISNTGISRGFKTVPSSSK